MRKLAIAMALASTALATPAVARDQSWYVGIEGGAMLVTDTEFDIEYDGYDYDDGAVIDHKTGVDLDLIAGYDFGMFRAEAELGYKRASIDELAFSPAFIDPPEPVEVDGNVRVWSAMANLMLDFGDEDDWSGYIGAGAGLADVRYKIGIDDLEGLDGGTVSDSDSSIAWQLIAGMRKAISYNLDLGVKYRYFVAPKVSYEDDLGELSGKFKSHSLLASLIYNFGAPPAPPPPPVVAPPPPPPPATQTCPDGSVILATDMCPPPPEPYVPPPPPEPTPERG